MKKLIEHGASCLWLILVLSLTVFFGCSCNTAKPTPEPDPLAGWTFREFDAYVVPAEQHHYQLNKAIIDDYQDFISKNYLNLDGVITGFYEQMPGMHAVRFTAFPPHQNASWDYVLIYDQNNHRIKVVKYNYRKYQS